MRSLTAAILLVALATPLFAQNSSALISEQLDKQVQLDFAQKTPLPQIMKAIADKTGVRIEAASGVYDLLPWGEQTTLTLKIENQNLRGALEAITRKLGLTFEVTGEIVEIRPTAPLKRLGRRATVEELEVLDLLARIPLEAAADRTTVKQLLATVDAKLEANKSPFAVEDRTPDAIGSQPVPTSRNMTLMKGLEAIAQSTDATWYPWGRTLVLRLKIDYFRDQLANKTTTRRFNGVDVSQVLAELTSIAGVDFVIEPGAVARIPAESRNVRLTLDNASIQQALDNLGGFTGLAWNVNQSGVYIWNPAAAAGANATREPTVGLLTLDNGAQVVLRESQVPPDIREYLKHKTDQQLEKIRQMMKEEGFKPTSQPSTQATTKPTTKQGEDL